MRKMMIAIIAVAMLVLSAAVLANPTGPTQLGIGASSRYGASTNGYQVNAYAGNVTELDINGTSITQGWQGYFGNVLGTIVLGDNNNKTLYDWSLTTPSGEIFASRSSITDWTGVRCANSTEIASEETALNFSLTAKDGIDETFGTPNHPSFYVGSKSIGVNSCNSTNLHNSTGQSEATKWYEVLLSDGSSDMVYTSLLENNKDGFNGSNYDFQMIVGEDGHNGDTSTTPYYFWVELE